MPVKESRNVETVENVAFFKAAFLNSMDAILITVPDGGIIAANPEACRIFGRSEAEIIKAGRNGLVDLSDKRLPGLLEERTRHGKARGELRMIRNGGLVFTAYISSSVYRTEDGDERTVMVVRDITDSNRIQEMLIRNEKVLRKAQDLAKLGNWDYNVLSDRVLWSGEMFKIFEVDPARGELSWIEHKPHVFHEDWVRLDNGFRNAVSKGIPYRMEFRILKPDKSLKWAFAIGNVEKDEKGNLIRLFGTVQDITERKLLEMALRKSEARYHMIFQHSTISIWEADISKVKAYLDKLKKKEVRDFLSFFREHPEKTVYCISLVKLTVVNRAGLMLFGVKDASDLSRRLPKLFTKESVNIFAEFLASLAEGRKQFEKDIPIKIFNGKIKHLNFSLQVLPDSFFNLSKVIFIWIDISDRVNYEEALKKSSETLRVLNMHIEEARENERAGISLNLHDDLGQKLTAIKMDLSWLKKRFGVQSQLVQEKMASIFRMLDDTVLTVQNISSDLWPGMLNELGLKTAVEWHLIEFTKNTGIKSTFKISPSELEVNDKLSIVLYRIIQESLTNVARHSKADRVTINMISINKNLKLIIKDNGIGIEKGKLNDPTSLGLLGLKERARAYGGELEITGKKGIGTKVIVVIPDNLPNLRPDK